jgi:type II secretory pathway pseudopilin PulG
MRGRGQEGMTLVEVLVAATILVLGIGATVTALTGARRLSQKSERKEQAVSYAQRDAESFRIYNRWEDVGTSTLPASGDAANPSVLVVTINGQQVLRVKPLNSLLTAGTYYQRLAPLVPTGPPSTENITIGNTKATVTRIVSYEEQCLLNTVCVGNPSAKRVTVRVQLDPINGVTPAPVIAQAIIANQKAV